MTNNNILPYFRRDMSTLFVLSAAIALLAISPLVLSNILIQPVQAQTLMTFKTPNAATYTDDTTGQVWSLTFDAQGTTTPSGPVAAKITSGTIQVKIPGSNFGPLTITGNITSGVYNTDRDPPYIVFFATILNADHSVVSACTTSVNNPIGVAPYGGSDKIFDVDFSGAVQCSPSQSGGGNATTTVQPSSSSPSPSLTAGSPQGADRGSSNSTDSDGDGIPDSSDRCPHNSEHRCFKEAGGNSSGTTSPEQQPSSSSSSSSSGNQTR